VRLILPGPPFRFPSRRLAHRLTPRRPPQWRCRSWTPSGWPTTGFKTSGCERAHSRSLLSFPRRLVSAHAGLSQDLEPLAALPRLCRLDLTGNPVTKQPHYRCAACLRLTRRLPRSPSVHTRPHPTHRLYLIALCPALKLLDFARVRAAEKTEAAALFGGADGAKRAQALAADSKAAALKEYAAASLISDAPRTSAPSQQQMLALKAAIAAAATLDEVHRLEKALASGVMPELAGDGDAAMQEG